AFRFENRLGGLKQNLRKPAQALQQIHRRLVEEKGRASPAMISDAKPEFQRAHSEGPLSCNLSDPQYHGYSVNGVVFNVKTFDRFLLLQSENYDAARQKLPRASQTSDLSNADEGKLRKRKRIPSIELAKLQSPKKKQTTAESYTILVSPSSSGCQVSTGPQFDTPAPNSNESFETEIRSDNSTTVEIILPSADAVIDEELNSLIPGGNDSRLWTGFENVVVSYLADIKLRLDRLEAKMEHRPNAIMDVDADDIEFHLLPFNNENDLRIFAEKLVSDKACKDSNHLVEGNFHFRLAILSDLLTDELAKTFSWLAAAKRTAKEAGVVAQIQVKEGIENWLRHARDRIEAKKKRTASPTGLKEFSPSWSEDDEHDQ
ncbi:unnamed protein product, partial [Allacma fusca]